MRLAPLMFTPTEALGLVMAVLEGHPAGEEDPVGQALGKIVRALPEPLARPADAVRRIPARGWQVVVPDVEVTAERCRRPTRATGSGCATASTTYASGRSSSTRGPWWCRHRRWYVLGWSHGKNARRVLRVDRVRHVEVLSERFERPEDLDALAAARGAALDGLEVRRRGRDRRPGRGLSPLAAAHVRPARGDRRRDDRLVATTDEPDWYAAQLANLPFAFRLVGSPEVREAMVVLGRRLLDATGVSLSRPPGAPTGSRPG